MQQSNNVLLRVSVCNKTLQTRELMIALYIHRNIVILYEHNAFEKVLYRVSGEDRPFSKVFA